MGVQQSNSCPWTVYRCCDEVTKRSPPRMTSRQKEVLREAWRLLEPKMSEVDSDTFAHLFHAHGEDDGSPELRGKKGYVEEEYLPIVRAHGLRIATAVHKCINRLDDSSRMHKMLENLGGRHTAYDFKIDLMELMGETFIEAVRQHSLTWDQETEAAWTLLLRHVIHYHRKGYRETKQLQPSPVTSSTNTIRIASPSETSVQERKEPPPSTLTAFWKRMKKDTEDLPKKKNWKDTIPIIRIQSASHNSSGV